MQALSLEKLRLRNRKARGGGFDAAWRFGLDCPLPLTLTLAMNLGTFNIEHRTSNIEHPMKATSPHLIQLADTCHRQRDCERFSLSRRTGEGRGEGRFCKSMTIAVHLFDNVE